MTFLTPLRNPGRVAGLWYLLLIATGPLRLIYIPGKLFVFDDPAATAANIAAHEMLFRAGVLSELAGGVLLVMMALAFYQLFKATSLALAMQVLIFGGVLPAVFFFSNAACDLSALMILHGTRFLSSFDKSQQEALAMLFLRFEGRQNTADEMLWGVWLFPLAALIFRSRLLPRWIAVWLVLNGLSYVLVSATGVLWPDLQDRVFTLTTIPRLGEMVIMLWLVVRGASVADQRGERAGKG